MLKQFILILSVLMLLACVPVTAFAFNINIDIPILDDILGKPKPPEEVAEQAQPAEQMPPQEQYAQDDQQRAQQEYPAEEFIPEGDPTPPPPLAVQNPDLVVVPSGEAQVYMVPDQVGVYFYGGSWYRFHHGVWFAATDYNAPWEIVQTPDVPSFVVGISPAYALYLPPTYYRIHYNDFRGSWRSWDREHRWGKERWYQNERRAEVRQGRERMARERMAKDRQIRERRIKERGHSAQKPGQSGVRKPGQFDQKKTGQQGPQKPGQFDQRKSGQAGPQKQQMKPQAKPQAKPQPKAQPKPQPKQNDKDKH
jgi:hypothetical protein